MMIPVEFINASCRIQGRFHHAIGEPPFATILLLQGFPGNEDDVLELGQRISQHCINALTFNYRGTHQSEGTFSWQGTLEDISAAIAYLYQEEVVRRFQIDTGKLVLGGYSYGGGMALAYAANHPEIRRIFSIAGTDHGEFVREYLRNATFAEMIDAMFEELKFPNGPVHFDWRGKDSINVLAQDLDPYDLGLSPEALADRDLFLIAGWDDLNVTIEHHILPLYRGLQKAQARQARICALQDDHAFDKSRDELARIVINWILSE